MDAGALGGTAETLQCDFDYGEPPRCSRLVWHFIILMESVGKLSENMPLRSTKRKTKYRPAP